MVYTFAVKDIALVTGASSGLGAEFARQLAAMNYDLVLVARSTDALQALADELQQKHGAQSIVLACDLSQPHAAQSLYNELQKRRVSLSLLVNNAGFGALGPCTDLSLEDQRQMIQVNVTTLTELTRLVLPSMLRAKNGRILNVASTAAFQPGPLMAVYYATKAYVLSFSLALSEETRGTGVTVTCLCPGPTRTGFAERAHMQKTQLFRFGVMDAASVVRTGIRACLRGRPLVTAGLTNKIGTFCTRLIPRMMAARIAASVQRSR